MRRRGGIAHRSETAFAVPCALALLCALALASLWPSAPARADVFGPISLVSEGNVEGTPEVQQAEFAHDTAISGNGRYVAFDGSFHGVTGVWRAEVQGGRVVGEIEQVAGGDAELPSISETGQYVSFTTNEGASLAEITDGKPHEAKAEAVNVYVRNMSIGAGQAGAFTVASAQNGSDEPLIYSEPATARGATAVGRSAISANGNEVAFVTTAMSDLVNPAQVNTPALQVAVRFIASRETKLVSVDRETGGPVSAPTGEPQYGAVYPGDPAAEFAPPKEYGDYSKTPPLGASISADGSTVAWMGADIDEQAQMLAHETRASNYTEPLWRRIQPGSETATERVTGGSDPGNPACVASGQQVQPPSPPPSNPCQGPFYVEETGIPHGIVNEGGGPGDFVPRLSADGYTVAFTSDAPLVTAGENFGWPKAGQISDLYVADMHPGLTRDQALTRLTELAGGQDAGLADIAPVFDFEISPDGSQVAFVTRRTAFPLGSPALVSPPAGEAGMNELFDADLADDTLTRVTHGYQGPDEPSEHAHPHASAGTDPYERREGDGAISPSFADDGRTLAFSSTASNLVFGDGNAPPAGPLDGSDAFVVERVIFQSLPTPQIVSPAPETATEPAWRLGMTALSRADGSVLLYVRTPGAGVLRAVARSRVEVPIVGGSTRARSRRSSHASDRRGGPREAVATRTVASTAKTAQAAGGELIVLVLKLAKPYAGLASRRGGLSAIASIAFTAPGEPTLDESLTATFARTVKPASRSATKAAHRSSRKKARRR
jgi:WD40-like Beta Propeller Repeat